MIASQTERVPLARLHAHHRLCAAMPEASRRRGEPLAIDKRRVLGPKQFAHLARSLRSQDPRIGGYAGIGEVIGVSEALAALWDQFQRRLAIEDAWFAALG